MNERNESQLADDEDDGRGQKLIQKTIQIWNENNNATFVIEYENWFGLSNEIFGMLAA